MDLFEKVNKGQKVLIGMVHCLPLPGTLGATATIDQVIERAVSDARLLEESGFDAVMVENEDSGVATHMTKLQYAGMSMVAQAVRSAISIPMGLCCSCLNYEEALSICKVAGGDFFRAPIFVDTVMNYNGIIEPCAPEILAYRKQIGAENVKILADVRVKYYYMVNPNIPITQSARWAVKQGADAVIVTGTASGVETSMDDLQQVKQSISIPVVVGSGITVKNIAKQLETADILIVGTTLRKNGKMSESIDPEQARAIVAAARG